MNKTDIVFVFAGDLWKVPRSGGAAEHLTSGTGAEGNPKFSPDGNWIGFYSARGRRSLLRQVVDLMLAPEDPYDALASGNAAPRQQLRLVT